MRVIAFRHVPFEGLGLIARALERRSIECRMVDLYEGGSVPDLAGASGLISMGGPMSANDDLPYLRSEIRLIEQAVAARIPVLGVCLGAQLLARALGARVFPNPVKEIGWAPVYWTEAAARDPLFYDCAAPETVLHWHGETFDLPAGAAWLAWSDRCRHQAFRAADCAWGLQFHLEVTSEIIEDWCRQDANCGDVRELDAPLDPHQNAARLAELAETVFTRWSELL